MHLKYPNKKSKKEILNNDISKINIIKEENKVNSQNKLFFGDNYDILKYLIFKLNYSNKVDLVYIDPPFSTNNTFKVGKSRANTISSSNSDEIAYHDNLTGSKYIEFLRERLILLRELMSSKGSIYLHIDYKIGHYVKIVMDEIFGMKSFRNDITRIKCNPKNFKRRSYGNIKDLILFYTKTNKYIWNEPLVPQNKEDIKRLFKKTDENGKLYTTVPIHAPGEVDSGSTGKAWKGILPPKGRHWRTNPKYLDELDKNGLIKWSKNGVPRRIIYAEDRKYKLLQDIWEYKDSQSPSYPTEKNIDLLRTIIKTSSNQNSLVLDAFAGSGTTLIAADSLKRNWIGIDNSKKAYEITKERLYKIEKTLFNKEALYETYYQVFNF